MKSIFDIGVANEITQRINSVNEASTAQWGEMDAYQMLKHCTMCEEMFLGKINIKRVLIGRLIGKMILKKVLKDESPFGRNSPTAPILLMRNESGAINLQKNEWIDRISQYESFNNYKFVHPFFGAMTKEQIGVFAYKHADHHLRQFGA